MIKGLKITALAVAMSMALGFGAVASAEESTAEVPVPKNSKTVKSNGDDTFDVALSFEGKVDTQTSTTAGSSDVILVVDSSGSMSGSRWDSLKNAVDILTAKVLAEGTNNKVSVVTFESSATIEKFEDSNWTNSAEDVKKVLELKSPWGGTDCAKALKSATTLLGEARENVAKYVVFLSDGYPNSVSDSVEASTNLKTAYPDATLFSVGIPYCDEAFLKKIADDESHYYFAADADELVKVFDGIATTIVNDYRNVVIKDTLGEYADYVNFDENGNPVFNLEILNENGEQVTENLPEFVYDAETKTVSLDLGADAIPDKWKYTITYTVKPSENAIAEYAENGYNAVGDANTDAAGNTTSSGKAGFIISTASLDFTYHNNNYSVELAKPVLQVQPKEESSKEPSEESSNESSAESSQESSEEQPSNIEPSSESSQGKTATDAPKTGADNNTTVIVLTIFFASVIAVISLKAAVSKKTK